MTLTPLDTPIPHDFTAIENGGKRFHLTATETVEYRWEPYKPDGQRQMKAKGRWQRMEVNGDFHRWVNCERPTIAPADEIAALQARVTELEGENWLLRKACEPFDKIGGELFCANANASDVIIHGPETAITFRAFLNLRATLKGNHNAHD